MREEGGEGEAAADYSFEEREECGLQMEEYESPLLSPVSRSK